MKIYFVTGNTGKVISARDELSEFGIQVEQKEIDIPEPRTYDIKEIAREKAMLAYAKVGKPLIVLDSGFYLNAWKDYPGPFTNHAIRGLGIRGILKLVDGEDRGCMFRNVAAYMDETHAEPVFFENSIRGIVSDQPRGEPRERQWSPLHTIFIPGEFEKTLAEMNEEEYGEYRKWRVENYPIFSEFGKWLKDRYRL